VNNVVNEQPTEDVKSSLPTLVVRRQPQRVPSEDPPKPTPVGIRLKQARNAKGLGLRELADKAGIDAGVISRIEGGRTKKPEADTLGKMAPFLAVTVDWLLRGEGEQPDATPPTPPARSQTRARATVERDDVEVDGWLFETLQKLKKPTYSRKNGQDAKAFLLSGPNLLDKSNPEKLVLGALEAARELEAAGKPTDPDSIMAYLIEKNAPPSGPQSGARADKAAREFSQSIIDKEKKLMAKEGFVPKRRRG
jgi:transcriptional regulator with XRE-family HTH domain